MNERYAIDTTLPVEVKRIPGRFTVVVHDNGDHEVVNVQTGETVQTFPPDDHFASDYLASLLNAQELLDA